MGIRALFHSMGITIVGVAAMASLAHAYNFDFDGAPGKHPLGSIGFYSSGCLDSDARIEGTEAGLLKLMNERDRRYGNPMMIELLTGLGAAYHHEWQQNGAPARPYERIQLGDIAQKGGGQVSKHASHQTGLDADVVYLRKDFRETKQNRGFEAGFDETFVHGKKVSANLDEVRQWWVWRFLYRSGKMNRIFVDGNIKAYFCKQAARLEPDDKAEREEVLRMLRPYPEHADHFHMRLACPAADAKCVGQAPLPPGSGCSDRELQHDPGEMEGRRAVSQSILDDEMDPFELLAEPQDDDHASPAGGVVHRDGSHTLPRECRQGKPR
ncbi:MAG: penicillin-insensitive murein endopeptidase [Deltaproteobacteria bacterium]|nr:penicillin-insensitive murein endopeptidase [Deltaproteobacteria bacterium]